MGTTPAYRTYVIAAPVPKGSVARALYWDTLDPYHYVRLDSADPEVDWLLVGGEDHKTGQAHHPAERWTRLEEWMRLHFPRTGDIGSRWSGQVMQSVDGLAFIGKNPMDDHVFIVTGDSGTGITHGAIAGMLIGDSIAGRENRWAPLYEPARVNVRAGAEFLRQNLGAIQPYADWLESGDVADEGRILRGHGAVIRQGLRLLAVFRDDAGTLHRCSAACPHLGGVVRWNGAESSWDCPCHGSRFDALGKVIHGPANVDLQMDDEPLVLIPPSSVTPLSVGASVSDIVLPAEKIG
jgi:nitrite reductase/ring-hydroxylating ferredoxin subunit